MLRIRCERCCFAAGHIFVVEPELGTKITVKHEGAKHLSRSTICTDGPREASLIEQNAGSILLSMSSPTSMLIARIPHERVYVNVSEIGPQWISSFLDRKSFDVVTQQLSGDEH